MFSRIRFSSWLASLTFHVILFGLLSPIFSAKALFGFNRPSSVLIRLIKAPIPEKNSAVQKAPLTHAVKSEIQKPASLPEKEALKEKQKQIDEKINIIRRKLHQAFRRNQYRERKVKHLEAVSVKMQSRGWLTYLAKLRENVLEKWYPRLVQDEGKFAASEVRIDFILKKTGEIENIRVGSWKGSELFRELSLKSFKEALPLAPLPKDEFRFQKDESMPASFFFYYQ